jgi:predicted MFS family arabinose efflux permease
MVGVGIGAASAALCAVAVWRADFGLFVAGNTLLGCYQAFAQYYRFAASEAASVESRSRAISWVIAAGLVAAVAGPNIARYTQAWSVVPFLWSFIVLVLLAGLAAVLVSLLSLPPPQGAEANAPPRPLAVVMRQPAYMTALCVSAVGYAVMIMVMTATPLAMQMCSLPLSDATTVIQWHVLGVFAPSFFTGHLIQRFGVLRVVAVGAVLLLAHVAVSMSGTGLGHFLVGLVLVGVGWNFMFIGGTTLLAQTYAPSERAKAQGMHDFLVFVGLTLASFGAGGLLDTSGWAAVNWVVVPLVSLALLVACAGVVWGGSYRR